MKSERLLLSRRDHARYFAPVMFCAYLLLVCAALLITALFLHNRREELAIIAAAAFGMCLSSGMGAAIWAVQWWELRYWRYRAATSAADSFERVRQLALRQGWRIVAAEPSQRLEARTPGSLLHEGEVVAVQFHDLEVDIATICDPSVGFSLAGRRRCLQHREQVRQAVA